MHAVTTTQPTLLSRLRNVAYRVTRTLLLSYVLLLVLMMFLETWLVYPVPELSRSDWSPAGVDFEEVHFASADGTKLHGWFFPRENAKRAILYCHGNGEQVADNADLMEFLGEQLNTQMFVFDYRGYGHSEGRPHEAGLIADGSAAQQWLAEKTGRQLNEITLMGRSIGGGVAIALAAENGAASLVLQNTFTRLTDAAASHYPWLPVRWLMRNRYDSLGRIASYDGPVFQSHGTSDRVVPFAQGEELFAAIPSEQKEFYRLRGGHNDGQPAAYYEALAEFLNSVAK